MHRPIRIPATSLSAHVAIEPIFSARKEYPMPTTRFAANVYSVSPQIIVLRMPPPYISDDFYLYQISICLNSGIQGFDGCWLSGNPSHGGSRSVDVDPTDFSRLYSECNGATAVTVTLTYHDGGSSALCVDYIDCTRATLHTALMAMHQMGTQFGTSSMVTEMRRANEIASVQLRVQEQILELLQCVSQALPVPPRVPAPGDNHEHNEANGRPRARA